MHNAFIRCPISTKQVLLESLEYLLCSGIDRIIFRSVSVQWQPVFWAPVCHLHFSAFSAVWWQLRNWTRESYFYLDCKVQRALLGTLSMCQWCATVSEFSCLCMWSYGFLYVALSVFQKFQKLCQFCMHSSWWILVEGWGWSCALHLVFMVITWLWFLELIVSLCVVLGSPVRVTGEGPILVSIARLLCHFICSMVLFAASCFECRMWSWCFMQNFHSVVMLQSSVGVWLYI